MSFLIDPFLDVFVDVSNDTFFLDHSDLSFQIVDKGERVVSNTDFQEENVKNDFSLEKHIQTTYFCPS